MYLQHFENKIVEQDAMDTQMTASRSRHRLIHPGLPQAPLSPRRDKDAHTKQNTTLLATMLLLCDNAGNEMLRRHRHTLAVAMLSPVTMRTMMPATWHCSTAYLTSSLRGSLIPCWVSQDIHNHGKGKKNTKNKSCRIRQEVKNHGNDRRKAKLKHTREF